MSFSTQHREQSNLRHTFWGRSCIETAPFNVASSHCILGQKLAPFLLQRRPPPACLLHCSSWSRLNNNMTGALRS